MKVADLVRIIGGRLNEDVPPAALKAVSVDTGVYRSTLSAEGLRHAAAHRQGLPRRIRLPVGEESRPSRGVRVQVAVPLFVASENPRRDAVRGMAEDAPVSYTHLTLPTT